MKIYYLRWITPVLALWMIATAKAQLVRDDLVVGVSSNTTNSFRIVRPSLGSTPGIDEFGGEVGATTPWTESFIQSVEFDNSDSTSHNAQGNLLGADFGGGNFGFELYNFATNGSGTRQLLWSIKQQTGNARTDRGAGLSVSPDNSKIAWGGYDGGKIHVLEYDAGNSIGTGGGASVTGWIETALGDGNGGGGQLTALAPSITQATAWLNNDTVLAFNGYGELISLDVSSTAFGTTSSPATTSTWSVLQSGSFAHRPSQTAQSTGLICNCLPSGGYFH